MLRIALLYLVLCIIAIRPILCDDTTLSDELMLELKEKVPKSRIGRRMFIIRWCRRQNIPQRQCVDNEIKNLDKPISNYQMNWAMEGVDRTGEYTARWMRECHEQCEESKKKSINDYELCRSDCILDKMCRDLPKQVQQVRKRSRRGRQYGR